jgi:hypothetical protein
VSDAFPTALTVLLLSACALPVKMQEQPARIVEPTAESRAELREAVSAMLHGAPVTLADDALMRDAVLVVERQQARDASGVPLSGRELGRPERFRLLRVGQDCVLVHERTGERTSLRRTHCRVL